jgi:hypothetical protein
MEPPGNRPVMISPSKPVAHLNETVDPIARSGD